MQQPEVIELDILRTQSDVVGLSRPVKLAIRDTKPFGSSNAKGNLKVVNSFEEARDIGTLSAKSLMAAIA